MHRESTTAPRRCYWRPVRLSKKYGLKARARVLGFASAGVAPRIMGVGPIPAVEKLVNRLRLKLSDFDVIELNEAFASQAVGLRSGFCLADDAEHVNSNGGAIALGHPLGMSGARIAGAECKSCCAARVDTDCGHDVCGGRARAALAIRTSMSGDAARALLSKTRSTAGHAVEGGACFQRRARAATLHP